MRGDSPPCRSRVAEGTPEADPTEKWSPLAVPVSPLPAFSGAEQTRATSIADCCIPYLHSHASLQPIQVEHRMFAETSLENVPEFSV